MRDDPEPIRNALVIIGTCLATPYLQDYDLVMSVFVVVWLKQAGERNARVQQIWIVAAMAIMLLLPLMSAALAKVTGLALGPLFIIPVFALLISLTAGPSERHAPLQMGS